MLAVWQEALQLSLPQLERKVELLAAESKSKAQEAQPWAELQPPEALHWQSALQEQPVQPEPLAEPPPQLADVAPQPRPASLADARRRARVCDANGKSQREALMPPSREPLPLSGSPEVRRPGSFAVVRKSALAKQGAERAACACAALVPTTSMIDACVMRINEHRPQGRASPWGVNRNGKRGLCVRLPAAGERRAYPVTSETHPPCAAIEPYFSGSRPAAFSLPIWRIAR